MQELQTITIKEYLARKGIGFREANDELVTDCVFCDKKGHLYFNAETGQYDCKACGEQGNIFTLAKHLGDSAGDVVVDNLVTRKKGGKAPRESAKFDPETAESCHSALPARIRQYLNVRGITDDLIGIHKLGWGEFYGKNWITVPIPDKDGIFGFMKLRKDPEDGDNANKYMFFPPGSEAAIYGWETLESEKEVVLCEGEFDRLVLLGQGIPAITSTAGAATFKKEWAKEFEHLEKLYICYDKDEAGDKGMRKAVETINDELPKLPVFRIDLPDRMADGKDITDYFIRYGGDPDELMIDLPRQIAGLDVSKFKPMTTAELTEILGLTIKKDEENKLVSFLCQLSAYTESCQFNISFNAPSSTGKSFIPLEVSSLFPESDLIKLGNCSPTAFFHEQGEYDKEKNMITVDLSRKILIFLDQPHNNLLARLRSLFSHDEKEMHSKITDKNQKGGNRTKTVVIRGFPAVIFCSAGLKIDEQEGTRFLLLSPETGQEKIGLAIHEKIRKEADRGAYRKWLDNSPERTLLKERIRAIKAEKINDIRLPNPEKIEEIFLAGKDSLKPRHSRDIGRLMSLIKSLALLNLWFRERAGSDILAAEEDVRQAVEIWNKISVSQEYNLPPYAYDLHKEVIVPAYREKNQGLPKEERVGITKKELLEFFLKRGKSVNGWYLRTQILPMLEASGLISQEKDPSDKRKVLITPNVLQ